MRGFIYIFFILETLHLVGQKPFVSLSSDVKTAQAGDQVTFTVKSNISGDLNIDFPKEFKQGNGSMNGMEQEMNYSTGEIISIYYFSQNGSFKSEGNYTFNAYITYNKKVYKSNALNIKIEAISQNQVSEEEFSKKNLKQPVFGIIQKSKTKIYEGEPLILEAKIYSKINVNAFNEYLPFEVEGGAETKEIDKNPRLLMTKVNVKGQSYLTFNYNKQLVFPVDIGKLKVKPFEMTLQYDNGGIFSEQISFTSSPASIEVIPLPNGAPKDFIGAVGEFELDSEISHDKVNQGDVFILKIYITGNGNLHAIEKPKIVIPKGISIYGDPEVDEEITYSSKGAEGKVTYTFNLLVKELGSKVLPPISFSYFSPEKKKYVQLKHESYAIQVIPSNSKAANTYLTSSIKQNEKQKNNFAYANEKGTEKSKNSFYNSKLFWPTVISPLFIAFLGFVFFTKKSNKKPTIAEPTLKVEQKTQFTQGLELIKNLPRQTMDEQKQIVNEVQCLLKQLGDCYQLNCFSNSDLLTQLSEKFTPEQLNELKNIIVLCEEINYSYLPSEEKADALLQKTSSFFEKMV